VEYSDNDRLVVRPGITLSTSQAPILFRVFGTSAHAPTASLKFVVEVSGTSASIQQLVEFFNFTSSTWEVMDQRNLTTSDTTITVSAGGAISRFIQAGTSEVRARVSYRATGPVLGFPWSTRIDMMHWVSELP
jgi:hypothetical protein